MKQITIYDASNTDRLSLRAWKTMVAELREYRELTARLIARNFVAQFRQSFLGYVWIILPPVATTLVFGLLRRAQIVNVPMPEGAMPYALFTLLGTTLWGFFTQVTIATTGAVSSGGALVSKIYFPREVLAISRVGGAIINLIIRLLVVALTFVVMSYTPHWQVLWAPLALIPIMLFAMGIGLFLAPLNTMMHDISRLLEFIFTFGMFLAPTVYPTPDINAAFNGDSPWMAALFWFHTLNPASHFMNAVRSLAETGSFHAGPAYWMAWIVSLLVFLAGWRFFHMCEPLLAERM